MTIQRLVTSPVALALTAALALSACTAPNGAQQCVNGTFCPPGSECSGDGTTCIFGGCGNAKADPGEACDDGNVKDGDGCSSSCTVEACGNGTRDFGEICDDGNTVGGDGCSADCKSTELCGNGIVDDRGGVNPEACDDGNTNDGDGCARDCLSFEICGNGVKNVGEFCDDGNDDNTDACRNDCKAGFGCGNGLIDFQDGVPVEECDDGDQIDTNECRNDCTAPRCGDGVVTTGAFYSEPCDPGDAGETSECNSDCTLAECGDGKVNQAAGEECDFGPGNSPTGDCVAPDPANSFPGCTLNTCGDGYQDLEGPVQEGCDDGNTAPADGCSATCTPETCGNGTNDPNEQCDDGNLDDGDGCDSNCTFTGCGNGVPTMGEQCDDGNAVNGDGCDNNCTFTGCGNDILTEGEDCDDGDLADGDGCDSNCTFTACGNGITTAGEQCDDGNLSNLDDCLDTCVLNTCGDGFLDGEGPDTEECDDGAANSNDCPYGVPSCMVCSTTCQSIEGQPTFCGDGMVQSANEACDDGNAQACGSCSADCQAVTSAPATGSIIVMKANDFDEDEDAFTLDDGFNPPVTFEFTKDGILSSASNVPITISAGQNATTVRNLVRDAINNVEAETGGAITLLITATTNGVSGSVVTLTHDLFTSLGNNMTQATAETVTDSDFTITDMTGGAGGDCADGVRCESDADCESNSCDVPPMTMDPKVCQAPPP